MTEQNESNSANHGWATFVGEDACDKYVEIQPGEEFNADAISLDGSSVLASVAREARGGSGEILVLGDLAPNQAVDKSSPRLLRDTPTS